MSLAIQSAKAQGDPGLFGFLGKAVGTVVRGAASFVPGPAGAVARYATSKIFPGGAGPAPQVRALPAVKSLPSIFTNTQFGGRPTPPINVAMAEGRGMQLYDGQGQSLPVPYDPTGVNVDVTPAIGCPKGYKPNKAGYYRRIKSPGNPEGAVFYIQPGSRCVKIRRRNAANPRAADRAVSRIQSAKRFATKMNRITVRKKCD